MNSTKRATAKDILASQQAEMAGQFPPAPLRPLLSDVTTLLKEKKQTVAVAETAAGGLISAALLSTPGASKFYAGGLTLYTLPSRVAFAGWTDEHIAAYKGPTPGIVAGLARSAQGSLRAGYVLAESGTAGPTGSGSEPNRQPGYVALAVVGPDGAVATRETSTGSADREANMVGFAAAGLALLRDVLKGEAALEPAGNL